MSLKLIFKTTTPRYTAIHPTSTFNMRPAAAHAAESKNAFLVKIHSLKKKNAACHLDFDFGTEPLLLNSGFKLAANFENLVFNEIWSF